MYTGKKTRSVGDYSPFSPRWLRRCVTAAKKLIHSRRRAAAAAADFRSITSDARAHVNKVRGVTVPRGRRRRRRRPTNVIIKRLVIISTHCVLRARYVLPRRVNENSVGRRTSCRRRLLTRFSPVRWDRCRTVTVRALPPAPADGPGAAVSIGRCFGDTRR